MKPFNRPPVRIPIQASVAPPSSCIWTTFHPTPLCRLPLSLLRALVLPSVLFPGQSVVFVPSIGYEGGNGSLPSELARILNGSADLSDVKVLVPGRAPLLPHFLGPVSPGGQPTSLALYYHQDSFRRQAVLNIASLAPPSLLNLYGAIGVLACLRRATRRLRWPVWEFGVGLGLHLCWRIAENAIVLLFIAFQDVDRLQSLHGFIQAVRGKALHP